MEECFEVVFCVSRSLSPSSTQGLQLFGLFPEILIGSSKVFLCVLSDIVELLDLISGHVSAIHGVEGVSEWVHGSDKVVVSSN